MSERELTEDPEEEEREGEREESDTRRRKNPRERAAMEAYEGAGWIVTTRGFPCFLAQKPGQRPRLVWVERKNINPAKAGLSQSQRKAFSIFTVLGLDARIVSPDQEPVCDPDSPLQPPPTI
jgi:hypothetical protein